MSTTPLKPLVLCADDYAQSPAISAGIRALAAGGRLSATSALVLSPHWREQATALAELRGQLDVGLHLDWTSAFAQAAGHGLSLGAAMRRALLGGFDAARARGVIERQLDAFEAAWGAPPDHVDGHQHVQQFSGIREPLVQVLAQRYGGGGGTRRPWLRLSRAPAGQGDAKAWAIAAMGAAALQRLATRAGLPCAPALAGVYGFDGDEATYARRMAGWLAAVPAGTVLMCHPASGAAVPGDGDDAIAPARRREFAHLASAAWAGQCASARVQLVRGSALYTARP